MTLYHALAYTDTADLWAEEMTMDDLRLIAGRMVPLTSDGRVGIIEAYSVNGSPPYTVSYYPSHWVTKIKERKDLDD